MKTALALLGLTLLPAPVTAESLQVLVLEVDPRLVGPTTRRVPSKEKPEYFLEDHLSPVEAPVARLFHGPEAQDRLA